MPPAALQVKVKKRGSDTKYLATVLAVGRECDIGETLPVRGNTGQRNPLLLRSACSPVICFVLIANHLLLPANLPACLPVFLLACLPLYLPALPSFSALLTVEEDEFWADIRPLQFGPLPRLQVAAPPSHPLLTLVHPGACRKC